MSLARHPPATLPPPFAFTRALRPSNDTAGTAVLRCGQVMPFREIVGHRGVITRVSRAVARGSLPPSVLLTGPDGVGKRLVAVAIAEAMNCADPRRDQAGLAADACGRCAVCGRIARGTYPDVVVLQPGDSASGSITVDQVRGVVAQTGYRPFEGRRRVFVIDQADLLVLQAQNALLKTLEEPPASAQFVLVTARPDLLLDTVRSRCPRLRFGLLAAADIADVLSSRHGVDPRQARSAAASAGGSLGRALRAVSGELAGACEAAAGLLESVSAAPDARARLSGAQAFVAGQGSRRAPPADRHELRRRLQVLAALLRDVEVIAARSAAPLANADLDARLRRLAADYGGDRGLRGFAAVDEAMAALDRNVSPKVVADWVACRI